MSLVFESTPPYPPRLLSLVKVRIDESERQTHAPRMTPSHKRSSTQTFYRIDTSSQVASPFCMTAALPSTHLLPGSKQRLSSKVESQKTEFLKPPDNLLALRQTV
jgi:hypothetical protein